IQITAPISHGSSGGPVLNKSGEVVGVAVASLRSGQNLNFAIPVSQLRSLLEAMQSKAKAYLDRLLGENRDADPQRKPLVAAGPSHKAGKQKRTQKPIPLTDLQFEDPEAEKARQKVVKARKEVLANPKSADAHFRLAEAHRLLSSAADLDSIGGLDVVVAEYKR